MNRRFKAGSAASFAWMFLFASLYGCASAPRSGVATSRADAVVASRADALLADLHTRGLFNGVVVLSRDGKILYENAWGPGDEEAGVPLTIDSPVDGASLAKNFTAAAVLMLVDEEKLDLDARVQQYVPAFPHEATSVRHLIEHSAGLPEWSALPERYDVDRLTNEQLNSNNRTAMAIRIAGPGSTLGSGRSNLSGERMNPRLQPWPRGLTANHGVIATVRPVTPPAGASGAPVWPARYALR